MSKTMNHQVTFKHYQEKGFKLFDKIRDFDTLTSQNGIMVHVKKDIKIKQDLELWEKQVESTGKKVSPRARAAKTGELQDRHYQELTPCERVTAILKNDYDNQKFNGRGKKLLTEEIEKLEPTIKTFSLSKENRKNKTLLRTMKSIVEKSEELEKIQQELRSPKKISEAKGKEKIASTGKRKIEPSTTEQEPKQKMPKNDMFSQREQQFKTGKGPVVSAKVKEQEEITIQMEEMDRLEGSQRISISV